MTTDNLNLPLLQPAGIDDGNTVALINAPGIAHCETTHYLHRFDRSTTRYIEVKTITLTSGEVIRQITEKLWPGL